MESAEHVPLARLEAALEHLAAAPRDDGTLELVVRRPAEDEREVLEEAELDVELGLVGDDWVRRGSRHTPDGSPDPGRQVTLTSARAVALFARVRSRWPLAGDQLYLDLDLGAENLPPGTRLAIGGAVLRVTDVPHRGCRKFRERFGADALRFLNSEAGRRLELRGIHARVEVAGTIRRGDRVRKV